MGQDIHSGALQPDFEGSGKGQGQIPGMRLRSGHPFRRTHLQPERPEPCDVAPHAGHVLLHVAPPVDGDVELQANAVEGDAPCLHALHQRVHLGTGSREQGAGKVRLQLWRGALTAVLSLTVSCWS